ncbi:hypothetical protein F7725_023245 [Dissostichus mawsoni]|uniref:PNPLA domain-containing protein n=1 Tax=Dissostichus mawsoni TaxID=36200 RepID=A0A7J5Z0I3_DISMA|nr:hypothetical protein F7725_023245 [Dissostichus mawsoni]
MNRCALRNTSGSRPRLKAITFSTRRLSSLQCWKKDVEISTSLVGLQPTVSALVAPENLDVGSEGRLEHLFCRMRFYGDLLCWSQLLSAGTLPSDSSQIYGASAGALMVAVLAIGSPIGEQGPVSLHRPKPSQKSGVQIHLLNCDRGNMMNELMGPSEKMFDWDEEWNISFAGCGFRSVYYLGALSCFLQNVPRLVHGASRICGASSGCLVAAALTVGIPIEQFCADVLAVAREARRHTLGVFHPSFSLLRTVRASLLEKLPADAHLKASGRLCVSLTRLTDGRNVLVSEFNSREELIQYYMDGALSNNMPLFERRNTITVAPFSGESDVCPRDGSFNFIEVHYGNVSIHVNSGNVHRIWTSFLPPSMELVKKRGSEELRLNGLNSDEEEDLCLGLKVENLPAGIKKVLCEAFRDSRGGDSRGSQLTEFLPVKMVLFLLSLLMLPFEMAFSLSKSLISSVLTSTGDLFRNTWSSGGEDMNSAFPERYAFNSDLRSRTGENNTNFSSTKTTNSNKTLHWDTNGKLEVFPLPSPCSGPTSFPSFSTPAYSKVSLNHRR